MSNFIIFKAAFNNSATPAVGTYTAEGATAQFNKNTSLSPDYYLYNTADNIAVQWFVPTAETTDFEFVADVLTRNWSNNVTYFIIADSTGATRLRMWSVYSNWYFENSDSTGTTGNPEYIGVINPTTSGGFGVFHQFRVRVRKLTASSSSVEIYVDGALKLTATAEAALVTCAKIGFVGGVSTFGPGTGAGVKNAYVYDLSGGEVIDRGVLSGAFNRFISWMKSKFALKSDIPTVNNGTLTIQQNGVNVQTFTANQATAATANIQCVDLTSAQTVAGDKDFTGTTTAHDVIPSATDTYNFGSPSYQWNNAYIKSLTINGVACGDILTHNASEFVDVSSDQTIGGLKTFSDGLFASKNGQGDLATLEDSTINSTNEDANGMPLTGHTISFKIKGSQYNVIPCTLTGALFTSGNTSALLRVYKYKDISKRADIQITYVYATDRAEAQFNNCHITTNASGVYDIGSSTRKWKSFNGINPGALSLPSDAYIDIDTTNYAWGSNFTFTPDYDGYCFLNIGSSSYSRIISLKTGRGEYYFTNQTDVFRFTFPVYKGKLVTILTNSSGAESVIPTIRVFSCQGNV